MGFTTLGQSAALALYDRQTTTAAPSGPGLQGGWQSATRSGIRELRRETAAQETQRRHREWRSRQASGPRSGGPDTPQQH